MSSRSLTPLLTPAPDLLLLLRVQIYSNRPSVIMMIMIIINFPRHRRLKVELGAQHPNSRVIDILKWN